MSVVIQRILSLGVLCGALTVSRVSTQAAPAASGPRIESGLESAVKWKWRVLPSDPKDWGLELPVRVPIPPDRPAGMPVVPGVAPLPGMPAAQPVAEGDVYTVKKGDALILIAKKFGMTVLQLKTFNGLTTDMIRVGQELKIPSVDDLKTMPTPVEPQKKAPGGKTKPNALPKQEQRWKPGSEMDNLSLQIFLDREQFSPGPIDAKPNLTFGKVMQIYLSTHGDTPDMDALRMKVQIGMRDLFAHYVLKEEDFRFIASPKAEKYDPNAPKPEPEPARGKGKGKGGKHAMPSALDRAWTYEELTEAKMLAYRSPWQFVAERFHCDETYLRSLNEKLKGRPPVGTDFRVPNVVPFEIETAVNQPLQPAANPQVPVRAEVLDLSLLQIFQGDTLVAVMPMSVARPGLRGKDTWTVLTAIPRPRLGTMQELANPPVAAARLFGTGNPLATPTPTKPTLTVEEYLPPGPKNPVGIIWINLAKAGSNEPLPYGLHGTSIPDKMTTQESLGGFRLTNWDIARAVHMLPPGTPLVWKQRMVVPAKGASPAAAPAALPATPAIPVAPQATVPVQ
ncbi:hypothetical protein BH09VER1_BH09VER1_42410 [soil metagenome]